MKFFLWPIFVYALITLGSSEVFAQPSGQKDDASKNIVMRIDEITITKDEVFDLMLDRYPREVQEVISELVIYTIVRKEAKKEKITIPSAWVEQKAKEEIQKTKTEVEKNFQQNWQEYLQKKGLSEQKLLTNALRKWKYNIALQSLIKLSERRAVQVEARHIMVSNRTKAEEILAKLKANASFEALAQQESQSSTKNQAGKLPKVMKGEMDPSLDRVLFSLKPDELSDVVQSPWGYHIIQVLKIYPPDPNASWEKVKSQIMEEIEKNPVKDRELERWLNAMRKKYPIKQMY